MGRIQNVKAKLTSLGISPDGVVEVSELERALEVAQVLLTEEMNRCQIMSTGQLKSELNSRLGFTNRFFLEKTEYVRAVAEARVRAHYANRPVDAVIAEHAAAEAAAKAAAIAAAEAAVRAAADEDAVSVDMADLEVSVEANVAAVAAKAEAVAAAEVAVTAEADLAACADQAKRKGSGRPFITDNVGRDDKLPQSPASDGLGLTGESLREHQENSAIKRTRTERRGGDGTSGYVQTRDTSTTPTNRPPASSVLQSARNATRSATSCLRNAVFPFRGTRRDQSRATDACPTWSPSQTTQYHADMERGFELSRNEAHLPRFGCACRL